MGNNNKLSLVTQYEDIPRYWTSGNTAEVDFLVQYDYTNEIIKLVIPG
jgi:hypothetical protein